MSSEFELDIELRTDHGKGASRRLRRLQNKIPAIVYGGDKEPLSVSLVSKDFEKSLQNEAFYNHILTLNLDGQAQQVVLKDLQRHPAKGFPLHADFLRIDADHKIHMHVPLHFLNPETCVGVKTEGGVISHQLNDVEISCLPKDLPEYLEVDMIDVALGQTLHLSDLVVPAGVEIVALTHGADHDLPVCNVHIAKGAPVEEEAEETDSEEESGEE
ncbi:MAG: 50S ribosomal protein L25/general stress protein Ctc [Gammaproteobacteria bacterium]|nr:50S ribosomal protein L25/general stress protein Ctc [Gammaproteobacteria bacterium]